MAATTSFQRFLDFALPSGLFDALEAGTRSFALECACGHVRDLWEAGGVKGGGNRQKTLAVCAVCRKRRWHEKRKKTVEELREGLEDDRRELVFLSGHAVWASSVVWATAAAVWAIPLFLGSILPSQAAVVGANLVAFAVGWIGPYFWATTRYRLTADALQLRSGCFARDLSLQRISEVVEGRTGAGISFAFDTPALWVGYPTRLGGYWISPRERALFLEMLIRRCPQLATARSAASSPLRSGRVAE